MTGFRRKIDVIRPTAGAYNDDGEWVDGTSETINVYASVQPLNADERAQYSTLAPEGASEYRAIKIYSNVPLIPAHQSTADTAMAEGDIVQWLGRQYRVVLCEEWQSNIISHYHMVAWEVDTHESGNTEVSP